MSDLTRVAAPDGAVHAVTGMSGREYRSRDGMFQMSPSDAAALVKAGGFAPSAAGRIRAAGYPCPCGFHSLFRTCSRCGTTNERAA
jgi:hypothetical protein